MINLLRPLIPVLALGVLTAPAYAFDTAACLQAPNQTCVFELALQQAAQEPFVTDLATGFFRVAAQQELAVAEAYADTLEAETTRQWAAGYLALDAAETGAFDEAIRLLQRPELRRLDTEDEWFIRTVAETYARLGRADIAEGLTAQIRPDIADYGTTGNVLNIAYAVAGEHEKFADRLRHQSPGDIESHVRWAIVAALNAGPHDMLRFLSAMPLEHQTAAHIGYGQALLDHDRFDEALDLYHLIAPHYLTEEASKARGRGLPQRIALELADRGRMDEALEIVAPLGPSWVTADIAAMMN